MGNKLKAFVLFLAAVLIGLTVWTVTSVPDPPPEEENKDAVSKVMTYEDNTIREEENGRLVWEVTAKTTAMDTDTQTTNFTEARGKYYLPGGKVLTLTAPRGRYNGRTKNVRLTGGVKAKTTEDEELTSQSLEWVASEDRLIATGKASVSKPGFIVTGDRVEAWQEFTKFRATGHAHIEKKE